MDSDATLQVVVPFHFAAPAEAVFNSWLDPLSIGQWMFGPALRDEQVLRIAVEPHVGGSFSFLVLRDGLELNHVGMYREVDSPRRLVFSWSVEQDGGESSLVEVDIEPGGDGCALTLTHHLHPDWGQHAARVKQGWTTMLEKLAEHLAAQAG